jgi:hypothetical protein
MELMRYKIIEHRKNPDYKKHQIVDTAIKYRNGLQRNN